MTVGRGRHGNHMRGEAHVHARLTEDQVRYALWSTESDKTVATRFSVHPATIFDARRRKTWKHITGATKPQHGPKADLSPATRQRRKPRTITREPMAS